MKKTTVAVALLLPFTVSTAPCDQETSALSRLGDGVGLLLNRAATAPSRLANRVRRRTVNTANAMGGRELGQELPDFADTVEELHIPDDPALAVPRLIEVLRASAKGADSRLETAPEGSLSEEEETQLEGMADLYPVAADILADAPNTARAQREARALGLRVIYTVLGDLPQEGLLASGWDIPKIAQIKTRALLPATEFPYVPAARSDQRRPGAPHATNLLDPNDATRFLSQAELSQLSSAEIANLDFSPDHPALFNDAAHRQRSDKLAQWPAIEDWVASEVTARLKKKFDQGDDALPDTYRYDLQQARRVLFWDGLRNSATSPKINVRDAMDQRWRLKWGEEAATEPMANRLWLAVGGRFNDLVYNHTAGLTDAAPSHLLVLPTAEQKAKELAEWREDLAAGTATQEDRPCMPLTRAELVECLEESGFDFNLRPYIAGSTVPGTVEEARQLLTRLTPHARKGFGALDVVGRTVVEFKESMVESKHRVRKHRGGPVPLYTPETVDDRAYRGMALFAVWVEATDAKEPNHRLTLLKGFGRPGWGAVEFLHDNGTAFGGALQSGAINELATDGAFLRVDESDKNQLTLRTDIRFIFRSGAWGRAQHEDLAMMARRIAAVDNKTLKRVASTSGMPDFYQVAWAWKLARRRDLIASAFGVSTSESAGPAPTVTVDLSSAAARRRVAQRYGIAPGDLEEALRDATAKAQQSKEPIDLSSDTVVRSGQLIPAHESVIVGLIRDARNPTGIEDRVTRWTDGRPYAPRRFGTPPSDAGGTPGVLKAIMKDKLGKKVSEFLGER